MELTNVCIYYANPVNPVNEDTLCPDVLCCCPLPVAIASKHP